MIKVRYSIERDGPPRLEVAWSDGYRRLKVLLDDVVVARSEVDKLRRGRTFELPDGRPLAITVERGIAMWIDGVPVPGTYADPWIRVKSAPIWVASVGALATYRAYYLAPERPWPAGTWANVALAVSLVASAIAMRRGSYWAHVLALVVALFWFVQAFPSVHVVPGLDTATLIVRVLSAVAYVAIAMWVLRKIAAGADAARELHPRHGIFHSKSEAESTGAFSIPPVDAPNVREELAKSPGERSPP